MSDSNYQKHIPECLTRSEERWRLIINKANDAIFILDLSGRFMQVNETLCTRLGYSAEELLGMNVSDVDPPEFARLVAERLAEVQHKGMLVFESAHVHRNGKVIPIELSSSAIEYDGQPAFLSIARDITERKQTERALDFVAQRGWTRSGDEFLLALVEFLSETLQTEYAIVAELFAGGSKAMTKAFWACGKIVPNIEHDHLCDAPCKRVAGKELCVFPKDVRQLFPEDRLLVDLEVESYAGVLLWDSRGDPIGLVAVMGKAALVRPEMVPRILQIVSTRAAHELERQRYDLQAAEHREHLEQLVKERTAELENTVSLLSSTLESTADGILVIDISGKTVMAHNEKFAQMWRIPLALFDSRANDRLIEYVLDQLDEPDQFIASIRGLYSEPNTAGFYEQRFKDGRIFELYSQPQKLENRCVGRVWSYRDVTAQRLAQENLKRYADDLETFNKAMVDREMRIIEIKEEVNSLCRELGKNIRYPEIWKEEEVK